MRIIFWCFLALLLIFQSCSNSQLVTENEKLKLKVADLEHRVYELSESPNQLAKDLIDDLNLLMTFPYQDNLELAQTMIISFKSKYPSTEYTPIINEKEIEIIKALSNINTEDRSNSYLKDENSNIMHQKMDVAFGVQINEDNNGFISVELIVENKGTNVLTNMWLKATLIDDSGESYGITQDYFFNRLNPGEKLKETLSWEYVQFDKIEGIVLKQLRYSQNRQTKMLQENECSISQGNVKIFLEF